MPPLGFSFSERKQLQRPDISNNSAITLYWNVHIYRHIVSPVYKKLFLTSSFYLAIHHFNLTVFSFTYYLTLLNVTDFLGPS